MIPSRLDLATAGLRTAVQEISSGEERAHAFLEAYRDLPAEGSDAFPKAIAALDRIDAALHGFRAALRELEAEVGPHEPEMVRLRDRGERVRTAELTS